MGLCSLVMLWGVCRSMCSSVIMILYDYLDLHNGSWKSYLTYLISSRENMYVSLRCSYIWSTYCAAILLKGSFILIYTHTLITHSGVIQSLSEYAWEIKMHSKCTSQNLNIYRFPSGEGMWQLTVPVTMPPRWVCTLAALPTSWFFGDVVSAHNFLPGNLEFEACRGPPSPCHMKDI